MHPEPPLTVNPLPIAWLAWATFFVLIAGIAAAAVKQMDPPGTQATVLPSQALTQVELQVQINAIGQLAPKEYSASSDSDATSMSGLKAIANQLDDQLQPVESVDAPSIESEAETSQQAQLPEEPRPPIVNPALPVDQEELADQKLQYRKALSLIVLLSALGGEENKTRSEELRALPDLTDLEKAVLRLEEGNTVSDDQQYDIRSRDLVEKLMAARVRQINGEERPLADSVSPVDAVMLIGGMLFMMGVLGVGVLVLVLALVLMAVGKWPKPLLRVPTAGYLPEGGLIRFFIYFVSFMVLSTAVVGVFEEWLTFTGAIFVAMSLAFLIALGIGYIPIGGLTRRVQDLFGKLKWADVGWGFAGYAANFPIMLAVIAVMNRFAENLPTPSHQVAEMAAGASGIQFVLLLLVAAFWAPVNEEITFRGWLFQGLLGRLNMPWLAILLAGIPFALVHEQGPMLWPSLSLIGSMAALLTYQRGTIWAAVIMHCLHNATLLAIGKFIAGGV